MARAILGLVLLLVPVRSFAEPVVCTDPDTNQKTTVTPAQLQREERQLQHQLDRRGIAVLDLSQAAQDHRRRLDIDEQKENWCNVKDHLRVIENALAIIQIGESFVSHKFSRIEHWVRSGTWAPKVHDTAERLLANAAARISSGRYRQANGVLNRTMATLFDSHSMWDMPAELPGSTGGVNGSPKVTVAAKDVQGGCPGLAKRGRGSRSDLRGVLHRLAQLMDQHKLRPIDIKGGKQLMGDLDSYVHLAAVWPAIRVGCALIDRMHAAKVDLNLVMKRFYEVDQLRDKNGVPAGQKQQFDDLVRLATSHIAAREYEPARDAVDQLLVLMGRPKTPSSLLPHLQK